MFNILLNVRASKCDFNDVNLYNGSPQLQLLYLTAYMFAAKERAVLKFKIYTMQSQNSGGQDRVAGLLASAQIQRIFGGNI